MIFYLDYTLSNNKIAHIHLVSEPYTQSKLSVLDADLFAFCNQLQKSYNFLTIGYDISPCSLIISLQ